MSRLFFESFFPAITNRIQQQHTITTTNPIIYTIYDTILFPHDVMILCNEIIISISILPDTITNITSTTTTTTAASSKAALLLLQILQQLQVQLPTVIMIQIRNPVLCIFAIIGTILGLYIGLFDPTFGILHRQWMMRLKHHQQQRHQQQEQQHQQCYWLSIYWSIAFIFFGCMNLVAIPLHCLLLLKTTNHYQNTSLLLPIISDQYPTLWMMDTFCTGVSSLALVIAVLHTMYPVTTTIHIEDSCNNTTPTPTKYSMMVSWLLSHLWHIIFICIVLCFGGTGIVRFLYTNTQSTIELELWYLLPLGIATILYGYILLVYDARSLLAWYYMIAIVWFICGILYLDPISCRYLAQQLPSNPLHRNNNSVDIPWWDKLLHRQQEQQQSYNYPYQYTITPLEYWYYDFFRLPAIMFGVCDLIFIGLYQQIIHITQLDLSISTTTTITSTVGTNYNNNNNNNNSDIHHYKRN